MIKARFFRGPQLLAMALYLCAHRPTTRQAIGMIRAYRLESRPDGTIQGLCEVLQQTLDTYLATHAPMSLQAVEQALAAVDARQAMLPPPLPPKRSLLERTVAQRHTPRPDGFLWR